MSLDSSAITNQSYKQVYVCVRQRWRLSPSASRSIIAHLGGSEIRPLALCIRIVVESVHRTGTRKRLGNEQATAAYSRLLMRRAAQYAADGSSAPSPNGVCRTLSPRMLAGRAPTSVLCSMHEDLRPSRAITPIEKAAKQG